MIYQNLFKTWADLASDEWPLNYPEDAVSDGQKYSKIISARFWLGSDSSRFQDLLQGYIQHCICDRQNWNLMLVSGDCDSERLWDATTWVDAEEFLVEDKSSAVEALLTAYLTALAAQRSPSPGAWQHFKGDVVEVVGEASWASGQHDNGYIPLVDAEFLQDFSMEEEPDTSLKLYRQGNGLFYISWKNPSIAPRVFYSHASENWARKTEDFLGLVGSEHPEHQGKLRFTEVSNAKA